MNSFRGFGRQHSYFEGWYLKHQKGDLSIAFIPAFHVDSEGSRTASIQVITKEVSGSFSFPAEDFSVSGKGFCVKLGNNLFSERGSSIDLKNDKLRVTGTLHYSAFTEPAADIMGPFRLLPFMQCSHGVLSMIHQLKGTLAVNGEVYDFSGGTGYVEKDYGSSFPDGYTWTQCSDWTGKQDCSLMASAAQIPLGPFHFRGCICAIWYQGKEYRLATYRGGRIVKDTPEELVIRQGRYQLSVKRVCGRAEEGRELQAPEKGNMSRTIRENIADTVHYCFTAGEKVMFDFTSNRASYEIVLPKNVNLVYHN